jgi:acetoin utilization deacetylase AcuC-like enzyme
MMLYYSPDYTAAGYAFDTTRKSTWIAESLQKRPIAGVELREPTPVTEFELEWVHDPAYIAAVRDGQPLYLAQSQGFTWDPGLWAAVCASTGGVLAAAKSALEDGVSGSLSSGLHHARWDSGSGFCTFNGLAMAASSAATHGKSVLILDLDAHCGGGTHSLIAGTPGIQQLDVSVSWGDGYEPKPPHTLEVVRTAGHYLDAVSKRLQDLEGHWDLCLYNAGMDPYEDCRCGGLPGITRQILQERERMVFDWCRINGVPVAFVLAGGYTGGSLDQHMLVDLHRMTIEEASHV